MSYNYNFYVLCIVRSHVNYTTPTVGTHDAGATIIVVSGGMSISRRCFYMVAKLIFIHPTINLYATSVPKTFSAHLDQ
jgi:hypothetical protein